MREFLTLIIIGGAGLLGLAYAIQHIGSAPSPKQQEAAVEVTEPDRASPLVFDQTHREGVRAVDAEREYVVVVANAGAETPVPLSGWRLRSRASGKSARLPEAAEVLTRHRIPQTDPVVLAPGQRAIVVTGRSPVGVSFRESVCTGYLAEFQRFTPPLSRACPRPPALLAGTEAHRDPQCQTAAASLPACTTELTLDPGLPDTCRAALADTLTYDGCRNAVAHDARYFLSTWRLYLGESTAVWRNEAEVLELVDPRGRVADTLTIP